MKNIFLANISLNNTPALIFTDGSKYSLVQDLLLKVTNFASFLKTNLSQIDYSKVKLDKDLPSNLKYHDLIDEQKIFATGCTFEWSEEKLASLAEDDVYKKAYLAERSMFFYKGSKENLTPHLGKIGIRPDSKTTTPEAEIVAVFNHEKKIIGYTIGNDVTAVDIEKQNPLFQMQAKFYKGSVALLPLIKLGPDLPQTNLYCRVFRNNECIVETSYHSKTFVRSVDGVIAQLTNLGVTPEGGFVFLGCGASYPKDKALLPNDKIIIQAEFMPFALETSAEII